MLLNTSLPGQAWDRLPRFFVGWRAAVQRGKITRPVFCVYTETGGGAHPRQSGIQRGDKGLSVPFYSILDEMIAKMTKAQPTDSLSHTFIVQMIPHHQAAIDMSCNILPYATFLPLQTIARNIITEQTQSIEKMQQILDRCGAFVNSEQDVCLYLNRFHTITERDVFSNAEGVRGQ